MRAVRRKYGLDLEWGTEGTSTPVMELLANIRISFSRVVLMRTSDLRCLLCLDNKSTKGNSHIVPKFMAKSVLGTGDKKRGYAIGTDKGDQPPTYVQDSPKEDFTS
jgi:hypothetical protein